MRRAFSAAAALGMMFLGGCEQAFQNSHGRSVERAEKKYQEGDFRAAVNFYEQALDGTPKSADIHYRLGLIYDDKLKDPVSAHHHFGRYVELQPEGRHARDARNFIKEGEFKLVRSFSKGALMTQEESARLKNDNLVLRKQLAELRARPLATPSKTAGGKTEPVQKPIPPGARTYTVQPGDTLASISRKFYKSPAKWKDLQDANFNTLEGTVKLKPGMVLIVP